MVAVIGAQRGIFERISQEIGRVEGLEADSEPDQAAAERLIRVLRNPLS